MKDLLLNVLIGATLITLGVIGEYLYAQWSTLGRVDETLKTEKVYYDAEDLYYVAIGDSITIKKD